MDDEQLSELFGFSAYPMTRPEPTEIGEVYQTIHYSDMATFIRLSPLCLYNDTEPPKPMPKPKVNWQQEGF